MFKFRYLRLTSLLVLILISGCKKPDPPVIVEPGRYDKGVWVLNEGGYTFGNASISFYRSELDEVENDVFRNNNGRPLGDVLQSLTLFNGRYYAVVNNSGKIEVLDPATFTTTAVMENLGSPRYFQPVSADKAYVTDLYAKGIHIINPTTLKVLKKIPYRAGGSGLFEGWTERMAIHNNILFVSAPTEGQLLLVDMQEDKIIDSIKLDIKPQWMTQDRDNKLWVLCNANYEQKNSYLYRVDPDSRKVMLKLELPGGKTANPICLKMNAARDMLYFASNAGVYKMNITDGSLPASPFIPAGGHLIYGLGIDPADGTVYMGDAVSSTGTGRVYRFSPDGAAIGSFSAGAWPSDFVFLK